MYLNKSLHTTISWIGVLNQHFKKKEYRRYSSEVCAYIFRKKPDIFDEIIKFTNMKTVYFSIIVNWFCIFFTSNLSIIFCSVKMISLFISKSVL